MTLEEMRAIIDSQEASEQKKTARCYLDEFINIQATIDDKRACIERLRQRMNAIDSEVAALSNTSFHVYSELSDLIREMK